MAEARAPGVVLQLYRAAARVLGRVAPWHLQRRLARGREDGVRWREKLGQAGQARPAGPLVWLHGVGLGEVMALRGMIEAMGRADPAAHFLITSSARSSAEVLARNLPARTQHQYLPLDAPRFVARFLDHWRPDLSVWSDQEIWPVAVYEANRRRIPLAYLNARISGASLGKRKIIRPLYADLLTRFQLILAQDTRSAANLSALGAVGVGVMASMKAAAPPLSADPDAWAAVQAQFARRMVWVAASTHPQDEAVALAAQAALFAADPRWLLVLAPRDPARDLALAVPAAHRRAGDVLAGQPVYVADSFGELGLWYRCARAALIGGSFSAVEGHNPWEAACLGCAVLHGPKVANFTHDYAQLQAGQAARQVLDASQLVAALTDPDLAQMGLRGQSLVRRAAPLDALAAQVLGLRR
ncbi:3-deoxy-D-manno-octulosonic-acid transferase [Pseudorhodobacter antarcticus]|uniref:3-deoxy-D-manno-octulosonic acid transferase n=1 Tax=Pseudorhodobacter antarcticus TaxID=1077947 RepID=A0A1H8BSF1_9RHOB|nr:glycosyltransferase N-terminal domain-containing protein [Pseudorhodobacter antarcticus]SEM85785.1 3-deoxy-D-manno-octulosonic-acid transferase [Pseudorhodobacter antarcticus]